MHTHIHTYLPNTQPYSKITHTGAVKGSGWSNRWATVFSTVTSGT